MDTFKARTKPRKCPKCGSEKVADILWGMPAYSRELQEDLDNGKIVLGGCCVTDNDPEWQCVDCEAKMFKAID